MNKVPYTNETDKFQHVGGLTIPPGETREVDPTMLPSYKPESARKEEAQSDPIADLLKKKVADVSAALPGLSDEDLATAEALEQDGQNRKSLIEAIAAENLRRADLKANGGQ